MTDPTDPELAAAARIAAELDALADPPAAARLVTWLHARYSTVGPDWTATAAAIDGMREFTAGAVAALVAEGFPVDMARAIVTASLIRAAT